MDLIVNVKRHAFSQCIRIIFASVHSQVWPYNMILVGLRVFVCVCGHIVLWHTATSIIRKRIDCIELRLRQYSRFDATSIDCAQFDEQVNNDESKTTTTQNAKCI